MAVPACDIGDEVLQRLRHGMSRHGAQLREKVVRGPPGVQSGTHARRRETPRPGGTARLRDGGVAQQLDGARTGLASHHGGQIRLNDHAERGFGQ